MRNIFLIFRLIENCSTNWGWRIIWIVSILTWWLFGRCFSIRCFSIRCSSLFICPRNFSYTFVKLFFLTLDGLRPENSFSTLVPFLIFIISFFKRYHILCYILWWPIPWILQRNTLLRPRYRRLQRTTIYAWWKCPCSWYCLNWGFQCCFI